MDNIKLYINASIDDVKNYIEKLIDLIKEKYPKFDEIYLKMNTNCQISYWNHISDKLNFFSNIIFSKDKDKDKNKNNSFFTTILFLLFGNKNNYNKLIHISINI